MVVVITDSMKLSLYLRWWCVCLCVGGGGRLFEICVFLSFMHFLLFWIFVGWYWSMVESIPIALCKLVWKKLVSQSQRVSVLDYLVRVILNYGVFFSAFQESCQFFTIQQAVIFSKLFRSKQSSTAQQILNWICRYNSTYNIHTWMKLL